MLYEIFQFSETAKISVHVVDMIVNCTTFKDK